ncbi:tetratricopeptide repeat protein [Bacteroidota bacterium]
MKTMTSILLIGILGLSCLKLSAQNDKLKELEDKAYTAYVKSSVFMWKQIDLEADKILKKDDTPVKNKIRAAKLKYGLLYTCLSNEDQETYEKYLDNTVNIIETLLKENPESSELHALNAAVMSVQMGFSPMKGMTLGAESGKHIGEALSLDASNPLAWRQNASSKYFTPKMFGGDINEAIKHYEHAIQLYEKNNLINDWIYLDALAWLGIAYQDTKQPEKAKATFEKALSIEPEFTWVKNSLLPSLIKS